MANRVTAFFNKAFRRKSNSPSNNAQFDDYMRKNLGGSLLYEQYGIYGGRRKRYDKDIYQPRERLTYRVRNQIAIDSSILRVTIDKKTKEVTRNGLGKVKKKFVRKCMREKIEPCENYFHEIQQIKGENIEGCSQCPNKDLPLGQDECGETYQTDTKRCHVCFAPTRPPLRKHKQKLKPLLHKYCNKANQRLEDVLFQIRLDVEKHDNGFLITEFLYTFNEIEWTVEKLHLIQIYRGDPARIRPVHALSGDLTSDYYTCIRHREQYTNYHTNKYTIKIPRCAEEKDGIMCNLPMQLVEYVEVETEFDTNPIFSFIRGEVFHAKEYSPASPMGISLIDSLYHILVQVMAQERWIAEYYSQRRMFKGIVQMPEGMAGGQHADIQKRIDYEMQLFRDDPNYIPWFGVPKDAIDLKFIRIDDSPKELQYQESNAEGRRIVSNAFGMSNVWQGDASVGSGLNNQGLELTVSNRSVAIGQNTMNNSLLHPMSASIIDINLEDLEYYIEYDPHEEMDMQAENERTASEIANMRQLQEMGFEILSDEENKLYWRPPVQGMPVEPASQQQGMLDGMGGVSNPLQLPSPSDDGHNKPFHNVDDMNEDGQKNEARSKKKPFQGAPEEPKAMASGLATKGASHLMTLHDIITKNQVPSDGTMIHHDLFGWVKPMLIDIKGQPIKHFTVMRNKHGKEMEIRGIIFGDGTTVIRWMTDSPSMAIFPSYKDFMDVHVTQHPEYDSDITTGQGGDIDIFDFEDSSQPIESPASQTINVNEDMPIKKDDEITGRNRGTSMSVDRNRIPALRPPQGTPKLFPANMENIRSTFHPMGLYYHSLNSVGLEPNDNILPNGRIFKMSSHYNRPYVRTSSNLYRLYDHDEEFKVIETTVHNLTSDIINKKNKLNGALDQDMINDLRHGQNTDEWIEQLKKSFDDGIFDSKEFRRLVHSTNQINDLGDIIFTNDFIPIDATMATRYLFASIYSKSPINITRVNELKKKRKLNRNSGGKFVKGEWKEELHPRSSDGKFGDKEVAPKGEEEEEKEPEIPNLDRLRSEVAESTKKHLELLERVQEQKQLHLEDLDKEYAKLWEKIGPLKEAYLAGGEGVDDKEEAYAQANDKAYQMAIEKKKVEKEIEKRKKQIKNETEKLNDPDKMLADRLYPIEKRYNELKELLSDRALATLDENIAFHEEEYPKVLRALETGDYIHYTEGDEAFVQDYIDANDGDVKEGIKDLWNDIKSEKEWFEANAKKHKIQRESREEYQTELSEIEDDYNTLKDIPVRKDGELWGYYQNTEMRGVDENSNTQDIDYRDVPRLIKSESKWIAERLGIDLENHPFKNVGVVDSGSGFDNENVLAYVNYEKNEIAFNVNRIAEMSKRGINAPLQNVIRHELAHYFEQAKQFPDIHKTMRDFDYLNNKWHKEKGLSDYDEAIKHIQLGDKIQDFRTFRIGMHHHSEDRFKGGHGDNWQDTMEILFGAKPTGNTIGDHDIPTEETK